MRFIAFLLALALATPALASHELRLCYRDTDDSDTLKVLGWNIATGAPSDVVTQYPVVMLAVEREWPAKNPVVNEFSGHDAYTAYTVTVAGAVRLVVQGITLTGAGKGVSRKVVPAVGPMKDEPVDKTLVTAVASAGTVSWPSAMGISSGEETTCRSLLGI